MRLYLMLYILHTNVRPDFDSCDSVPLDDVNVRPE